MSTQTSQEASRLLTEVEWAVLSLPMRVDLRYQVRVNAQWEERPFVLDIDARPLAVVAESAALSHRLYEFMQLRRPGDLLRYWWTREVEFGPELAKHLQGRIEYIDRQVFGTSQPPLAIPFTTFDACFWNQESRWVDEDMNNLEELWSRYRRTNARPPDLDQMFGIVEAAQLRLRSSRDPLLQYELALTDSRKHDRDGWASPGPVLHRSTIPAAESAMDAGLFELIVSLSHRADVRSVSCPFDDRLLWRALVLEQVRRAALQGIAPAEALFLAGPESGLTDVAAEDWGGDIHIPYEGVCEADLFIVPKWHSFDRKGAAAAGTARAGVFGRAHRYVITRGDPGEFARDERMRCGESTMYRLPVDDASAT